MEEMTEFEKALNWCVNDLAYKAPELLQDKEFVKELAQRYINRLREFAV